MQTDIKVSELYTTVGGALVVKINNETVAYINGDYIPVQLASEIYGLLEDIGAMLHKNT
tara:strand:+ start:1505 stop:1681 length:177 start_codon:yes stop_codon:yes gene_type:complete